MATKKGALLIGVALLIVVSLGVRFLAPHTGPRPKWSFQASADATIDVLPVAANGMVYVVSQLFPSSYRLSALDARSGSQHWSFGLEGFIADSPLVAQGTLYVVSDDLDGEQSTVYALDARSGHEQWSFQTDGPLLSPPTAVNGTVYVPSGKGTLYALDAHSGHTLWAAQVKDRVLSSPIVADGMVYLTVSGSASSENMVSALDASTGHQQWSSQVDMDIFLITDPLVVVNGLVYVVGAGRDSTGTLDGMLEAFDASTGHQQWSYQTASPIYAPPTVSNGMVYLSDDSGDLEALDARSGSQQWSFQVLLGADAIEAFPTVAKGSVYLAGKDGTVYALDASTGHQQWSKRADYYVGFFDLSPMVVVNGLVYGDTQAGSVYVLDGASGSEKGAFQTSGSISFAPTVGNGLVYVVSNGTLDAIQLLSQRGSVFFLQECHRTGRIHPLVVLPKSTLATSDTADHDSINEMRSITKTYST